MGFVEDGGGGSPELDLEAALATAIAESELESEKAAFDFLGKSAFVISLGFTGLSSFVVGSTAGPLFSILLWLFTY